jgi:hypothetical protein
MLTLVAIAWPTERDSANLQIAEPASPFPRTTHPNDAEAPQVQRPGSDIPIVEDPFAPRNWAPIPVVVVQAPIPIALPPVAPPAPSGPPSLPFQFAGRLTDSGDQIVYLTKGEQMYFVRKGEIIEATYKVLEIESQRMELLHLPTGTKQQLTFPGSEN